MIRPSRKTRRRTCRLALETLELRQLLAAGPIISEFGAVNNTTIADFESDSSDWIEIYNPTVDEIDLSGWHLTDRADNLDAWQFPDVTLPPDEYLVVFASEKDLTDPAGELHTNFKLNRGGEFLALVEPDGQTVAFAYAPEYPEQFDDVSFGLAAGEWVTTVLDVGAEVRSLVPADDSLGDLWTSRTFDDSAWSAGATGVGFEIQTGYEGLIQHDVGTTMHGVNSSVYLRSEFDLADVNSIDRLTLAMQYDDGFVAYLNGRPVAMRNAPVVDVGPWPELLGHWTFDDATSAATLLDDISTRGADNNGTQVAGAPAAGAAGRIGGAIELFGNQNIHFGSSEDFETTRWSASMWLWVDQGVTGWRTALGSWDGGTHNAIHLGMNNNGTWGDHGGGQTSGVDPIVRGQWYHVVSIRTPSGEENSLWINGVKQAQTSTGEPYTPGDTLVYLGTKDGGNNHWDGRVDDLGYFGGELTAEQINVIYQNGLLGADLTHTSIITSPPLSYRSSATAEHPDAAAIDPEVIDITPHLDVLQPGTNVLAIHGLNVAADDADFLIVPRLAVSQRVPQVEHLRYFTEPTPGWPNGTGTDDLGPAISSVTENPPPPAAADLPITAVVRPTNQAISGVALHYRVMFGPEVSVPMADDGLHGDGAANDGVYGAMIPAGGYEAGEMVRWYVTARDSLANDSRWPLFAAPVGSPEYFGTVVLDPAITTNLPLLQRFVEDPAGAETRSGTRASVSYAGEFYDNVFVRIRGGTSVRWPKKSYKIKFNEGRHFRFDPDLPRVDEINVNTTYTDKSYVRTQLAYEVQRDAGLPSPEVFPIRMEQNGEFFSVALFVEQPDKDFLRRQELDVDGALYKGGPGSKYDGGTGSFEKQTRLDEDKSDLQAFITGLAQSGAALETFLFDNVDLPGQINFLATTALTQNIDASDENHYVYRDTEGTGEWRMLPWDQDLTFGPNALNTDTIVSGLNPLLGGRDFMLHANKYNDFIDRIYDNPRTREMFLRRLRTLADEYLATTYFHDRIDDLVTRLGPDVLRDKARWGANAHFGNTDYTLEAAAARIENEYLGPRRTYLLETLNDPANGASVVIPDMQPPAPTLAFGAIDYSPASTNHDQEFIELINPNGFAVDISGWRLAEAVDFIFSPGTVIPAGGSLYVTPDVAAFRARQEGPAGGQGRFVQGGYQGHLSSFGETIRLLSGEGTEIASHTYAGDPSAAQQFLRITEINYNPAYPSLGEIAAGFSDPEAFEFIELQNVGDVPLDLQDVQFVDGVGFHFPSLAVAPGQFVVVAHDPTALAARYDMTGITVVGPWDPAISGGDLKNGGEQIVLIDPLGATILDFTYDDSGAWPGKADGRGATLELLEPAGDYSDPDNWRSSAYGGSPGTAGIAPYVDVVINEVLTHTDPPLTDAIELHNTTNAPVHIGGWYLSDSWGWDHDPANGNYKKFRIPNGTTIPAGGYLAFDESDFNDSAGVDPQDFALDGAHGDDVWLMQADAADNLIRFADHTEFGAAANGESFGRWPEPAGDLYPMISRTFGTANSGPRVGPLVVSEVMYHAAPPTPDDLVVAPNLTEDDLEYIEIFNPTSDTVDLTDWQIRGGIDFDFPAGTQLLPGRALVVLSFDPAATDGQGQPINGERHNAFRVHYQVHSAIPLMGGYSGRLDDAGERVRLQRPDEPPADEPTFIPRLLEDAVRYEVESPWPNGPAGSGASLTRYLPAEWGQAAANWTAARPTPGIVPPLANPLLVTQLTPTASGFVAEFDEPFDVSEINLYDVEAGTLGPADVTLVGNSVGPVAGSVRLTGQRLTFVATGGPLPADTYTVTLRSAADGFRKPNGQWLDGENDQNPGGDYVTSFTAAPEAITVGLPDFTRGPGQPVKLPATDLGLPLVLSDQRTGGPAIHLLDVTIVYDPALLAITAAQLGPDAPGTATLDVDTSLPGRVALSLSTPQTPLSPGTLHLVSLTADVPAAAEYGATGLLEVADLRIGNAADALLPATADDAVHLAAYFGDSTGNGEYSGLDAQRVARVGVGLDGGLSAFPLTDPLVVADISGNGSISGLDAQRIALAAVGLAPAEIPPLPQPLRLSRPRLPGSATSPRPDAETSANELPKPRLHHPTCETRTSQSAEDGLGHTTRVDGNLAGHAWYFDPTPWYDASFPKQHDSPRPRDAASETAVPRRLERLTIETRDGADALGPARQNERVTEDTPPPGTGRGARFVFIESALRLDDAKMVAARKALDTDVLDRIFASYDL